MKKNKLYTANKWNQPAFVDRGHYNIFDGFDLSTMARNYFDGSSAKRTFDMNLGTSMEQQYLQSKNALGISKAANPFSKVNMAGIGKAAGNAALSAGAGLVGSIGSSLISGGLQSSAGNAIGSIGSTIGGAVGMANPAVGAVISAGSQLLGGLANRAFGSKLNEQKIAEIENQNAQLNQAANTMAGANKNDLINTFGNINLNSSFSQSDVGEDGWFSSDAEDKYEELKRAQDFAKQNALLGFRTGLQNVENEERNRVEDNFIYGLGGKLFAGGGLKATFFDGGGYLFGNGGGTYNEVSNEISPDLAPVVSREYQPLADQLKQQEAGYNIDDYSYRVQKLHPDITREQVAEAYNNVPVIASSIDNKQLSGSYDTGSKNEENYGHRIMLYGLGKKGANSKNIVDIAGKTLSHETNHLLMDKLLGDKSAEDEKDMLFDAYNPFIFNTQAGDEEMREERATNAGLRKSISQKYGNVTGADLDKAIDNISDQELSDMYFNQNGYVNKEGKKHFRPSAVRKALKTVAYNTDKNPYLISDTINMAALGGQLNKFADGGLKASFMDEFGKDPIGAAVRYNQGLEALAAEREAKEADAAREAEYADMQKRLLQLETSNQGLQALVAAQSVPATTETAESLSTPSAAAYNSNWDYIEDQLKRSGKFNDVQIQGIKYNLQRESGIGQFDGGDNGTARGLAQWRGNRIPKDMSLEGQTKHLIETLSNFDGNEHWIGRKNYEGFLNARTPEEAHYYIAKGYERPASDILKKVKRDSDMSLKNLSAFGGELGTNGTDFTNGLLYIDEGGSHEENPLEGVPMGLDPQGIPNLVEEGETVYNDYVFSDRMKVPFFMYKELGLGGVMKKKGKEMSFADASKKLAQESEQRPNDPISQAGLDASLAKLAEVQEAERMRKQGKEYMGLEEYACGGKLNKYAGPGSKSQKIKRGNTGLNTYKFDPIDQFKYWDREANDYDEGYRDFIENKLNEDWIARAMSGQYGDMSRYKGANNINPTVEQAWQLGLDKKNSDWHKAMAGAYDEYKANIDPKTGQAPVAPQSETEEEFLTDPYTEGWEERRGISTTPQETQGQKQEGIGDPKTYATWMRYAPAVGSGIMALTDVLGLTNKPDYTYSDKLEAAANKAGVAPNIGFKPIGNYLTYRPMDIWFEQNRMDANSRATDRAIQNNAGPLGTKMAGLLANGYNSQIASGNLYRQALEYNDAKRKDVAGFNRSTDMFNSQMGLEAAMANARYSQAAKQMGLSGLAQAAAMRDSIDARVGAARSANLTNFLNNLGNIGRENFAMNQINTDKSRNYYGRLNGDVSGYKRKKSCGGKLNRK